MSRYYFLVAVGLLFGVAAEAQAQSFGPVQTFAVDPVRVAPIYTAPALAAPLVNAPVVNAPVAGVAAAPHLDCETHYAARPVFSAPGIVQPFRRVMRPVVAYAPVTFQPVVQTTYRPVAPVVAYSPVVAAPVVVARPVVSLPAAPLPVLAARPVVVGPGIYGQPTAYVVGQPLRNAMRYVTP